MARQIYHITRDWLSALAGKTMFTVVFIKKSNGERRTMNCRLGVYKHLNPNSKGMSQAQASAPERFNLLRVYENGNDYRTISCDNILSIKARGLHISRERLDQPFKEH